MTSTAIKNENTDLAIEANTGLPIIVKVMIFCVSLILVFTLVANILPQVEGQAPEEKKIDLNALTMDSYIAMGEEIFAGKGGCTVCHNNMGRAPDIMALDMSSTVEERLADSNYKGDAKDSQVYLYESMVDPSIYVVAGFGKKGAEHESPMPVINKPPTDLSEVEMNAVIAFLQTKDGGESTVELPTGVSAPVKEEKTQAPQAAATAEEALKKFTCTACHAIFDSPAAVGPKLSDVGDRLDAAKIRESILNPAAVIAAGFPPIMPPNLADKMMVTELEMIVSYLAQQKSQAPSAAQAATTDSLESEKVDSHAPEKVDSHEPVADGNTEQPQQEKQAN